MSEFSSITSRETAFSFHNANSSVSTKRSRTPVMAKSIPTGGIVLASFRTSMAFFRLLHVEDSPTPKGPTRIKLGLAEGTSRWLIVYRMTILS